MKQKDRNKTGVDATPSPLQAEFGAPSVSLCGCRRLVTENTLLPSLIL